MKVVINSEHGGFNLSDEAVELCINRGMPVRMAGDPRDGDIFFVELDEDIRAVARRRFAQNFVSGELEKQFRCNPIVVSVVEDLGPEKASGAFASLKVIEVPFDSVEDWQIDEYDGKESVIPRVISRWS
jgi:hypothetical protein